MSTRPEPACDSELEPATEPRDDSSTGGVYRRVRDDESGAILVLGIFMCACLVGILWYLAGIGDTIIYRERMQEGADAAAFSGAVLHARGMNLIVMINLIMACVLAVRVALKVIQAALLLVAAIFFWVPGVPEAALTAAEGMEQVIKAAKPFIDGTLKALAAAQTGIAHIVPPAALVGSVQVSKKFGPIVKDAGAASPITFIKGLPVEAGSPDVLCMEAGRALGELFGVIIPLPPHTSDLIGRIVEAGGAYFCDIGSGGSPPDFSSIVNTDGGQQCNEKHNQLIQARDQAQAAYQSECDAVHAPCASDGGNGQPVSATDQAQIDDLRGKRDAAVAEEQNFHQDECEQQAKDKANETLQKLSQSDSSGSSGIAPKKVRSDWQNGLNEAQLLSVALGNRDSLKAGATGVIAGEWKSGVQVSQPPPTSEFALAQAEFFYDCSGKWDSDSCNKKDESAMWHFHWRARFRRFNAPFGKNSIEGLSNFTEFLAGADVYRQIRQVPLQNTLTFQNALLLKELGLAILPGQNLVIH